MISTVKSFPCLIGMSRAGSWTSLPTNPRSGASPFLVPVWSFGESGTSLTRTKSISLFSILVVPIRPRF